MFQILPQSRIVYHGTKLSPGSLASSNLKPPSVENPFFVASNPRIAISYLQTGEDNSLYVLRLRDEPSRISLNLYDEDGIDALAGKLPKTASLLREYFSVMSDDDVPSFWLLAQGMVFFLECAMDTDGQMKVMDMVKRANRRMSDIWNSKRMPTSEFVGPLVEMGLVTVKRGVLTISNPKMMAAMKFVHDDIGGQSEYFEADVMMSQHRAGRVIKKVVNKVAVGMGYHMVGDFDSSRTSDNYGIKDGREYAVLDMDVFDYMVDRTIPEDEASVASEALARGLDFKGSGMNDPNEKAASILSRVRDSWIRMGDFPNFVKARATRISVPRNVSHVSDFAFSEFKNLEYIEFSEKTENFGRFCLAYCWNLKKVVFKGIEFNRWAGNKSVHSIFSSPTGPFRQKVEIVVPPGFKGDLETVEKWDGFKVTVSSE